MFRNVFSPVRLWEPSWALHPAMPNPAALGPLLAALLAPVL
jgi:hypothetical protein